MIKRTDIGMRIRKCRECHKYTREQLAELADISPVFLQAVEHGKKGISINTLAMLAAALQVSTDYILFGFNENIYKDKLSLKNVSQNGNS